MDTGAEEYAHGFYRSSRFMGSSGLFEYHFRNRKRYTERLQQTLSRSSCSHGRCLVALLPARQPEERLDDTALERRRRRC